MIANLSTLLAPFLPFSSATINSWFALKNDWVIKNIPAGFLIPEPEILYERLDKTVVDDELERLQQR